MPQKSDTLPELCFSETTNPANARRVSRLAASGRLRKLYAGVYTSNLGSPPEVIVNRHWQAIVGHLLAGGVISHRSAIDGKPHEGKLVITRGKTRRTLELPGLTVHVIPGPGAQAGGPTRDVAYGALFLASEARRVLENLTTGKGWADRVLPREEVENQLERVLALRGEHRLNDLRDQARELADALGLDDEFRRLDAIIGALLGTHAIKKLTAKQALARARGRPYDPGRLETFDALFAELHRGVFAVFNDPAPTGIARENFAFFESYFSNFIEGTTFTVEEAENIVFKGQLIENRREDSHDILGTFTAATSSPWRDQPPESADEFLRWLKNVNALIMQARPDKKPGEWKDQPNQAGSTLFVLPDLVPGTLREGFERIQALTDPVARALMTMFVVTEVHPFLDGNSRTARLAMNCVLTDNRLCRIIVPTIYRDDYLLPLKALSNNNDPQPYVSTMRRAQAWSAAFNYGQPRDSLRRDLAVCNAFREDLRNFKLLFPESSGTTA